MGIIRKNDKTENSKKAQNYKENCNIHPAGAKRRSEIKIINQISGNKDSLHKNVVKDTTKITAIEVKYRCRYKLLKLFEGFVNKVNKFLANKDSCNKKDIKKDTVGVTVVDDKYRYKNMEEEFHDMAQKYYYLYEIMVIAKEIGSVQKYQDVIYEWEYAVRQLGAKYTMERWNGLSRKYFNNDWFGGIDTDVTGPKAMFENLRSFMNDWHTTITALGIKRYNEKNLTITSPADKYKFYNIDHKKIGDTVEILYSFWYVEDKHGIRIIAKGTVSE